MKAITICQPYAALIMLPDDDPRAKRCENRSWASSYQGQLLIHAGKSKEWLDSYPWDGPLTFGAIVGVCRMVGCARKGDPVAERRWLWLNAHEHYEGPFAFVLTECRAFAEPILYRGAQGFFDIPHEVVADAIKAAPA